MKVPWKSILTSLPVASVCLCYTVSQWVRDLLLTNGLLYLSTVGFNVAEVSSCESMLF
ncbi:hypothetical protein DPMN_011132 [Dreissena polymorpha]|uniref:Uncharacterized protein n=1 Tax=Dreissena polymorpha TaxID=45954 RepID=A0A9D4S271_DREPO|nr:hypothetical protein DPMN_011132 [Dreissena polymorpha]